MDVVRIEICGLAAVFRGESQISDPAILSSLEGLVYDDERFTDYLGGTDYENELASVLAPGGTIRFGHIAGAALLTATTEYCSRRLLNESELTR